MKDQINSHVDWQEGNVFKTTAKESQESGDRENKNKENQTDNRKKPGFSHTRGPFVLHAQAHQRYRDRYQSPGVLPHDVEKRRRSRHVIVRLEVGEYPVEGLYVAFMICGIKPLRTRAIGIAPARPGQNETNCDCDREKASFCLLAHDEERGNGNQKSDPCRSRQKRKP